MKILIVSLSLMLAFVHLCKAQPPEAPPDFYNDFVRDGFGFWENPSPGWVVASNGDSVYDVQYVSDGALPRAFIRRDAQVSFVLASVDTSLSTPDTLRRLDMSFSGELFLHPDALAIDELPGHRNFYLPHCGPDGITDVHAWNRIVYENIYTKIDFWLYCGQRGQKMAIVVHPGGNPEDIRLLFDGQDDMDLDVYGNLKMLLAERWIALPQAVAYQYDSGNGIHPLDWTAEYVPNENTGQVGFTFDEYDTSKPLVLLIGPPPMPPTPPGSGVPPCWSTYVSGNGIDAANANGVDADGNSYVAGLTRSHLKNT